MPETSTEEVTVCPGEYPRALLNSDISYYLFIPFKFLTVETILGGLYLIYVCMCLSPPTRSHTCLVHTVLIISLVFCLGVTCF